MSEHNHSCRDPLFRAILSFLFASAVGAALAWLWLGGWAWLVKEARERPYIWP